MVAGQWEFTLTGTDGPRTMKQCMTPDQANEMNGDTNTARGFAEKRAKGRCTIKSYEIQGNTVKYSLVCGDRTIDSSTTFKGDTSEGTLTTFGRRTSRRLDCQGPLIGSLSVRRSGASSG
jgi:hypothetical protein